MAGVDVIVAFKVKELSVNLCRAIKTARMGCKYGTGKESVHRVGGGICVRSCKCHNPALFVLNHV